MTNRRQRSALTAWVCGGWLLFAAAGGWAAEAAADVKAAFVYNFAKFVEWPVTAFAAPDAPLWLCVPDAQTLDGKLNLLSGREAQGHRIEVVNLADGGRSAASCHLLFIPATQVANHRVLLTTLGTQPVLTLSDARDFDRQGGMISLFIEEQRLKFSVDLAAVQTANLKMSARILQLATRVARER